ncbi:group III truncated hemoglobin [Lutimaribacter sp. EGI FJ00015]|uniref:Group III truncated hemoglobin n=1 Tax=Lutimaribacter degradans TaxID=2945989 RepID=A0ACC5ZRG7_9RHOB|nr:group III truncated hemoglobin [Lutimaribacter sp. EGI FJ00013]MCM2560568.1 group III truncated hemoglobin [Lutimaribacter sp. EGI FJ00013]MCO0612489.1 group III truncated hemoglobin [Lutimaribacter sp. EGI FJ00015]MCO0634392.1 group III truncated hemoglobin [Lutimaribacter sp. EGI FJ00014]
MTALPPRFEISDEEIARVVATFYAHVREHPALAPVFAVHVNDWPAHEERVAAFWRKAIRHSGGYDGNVMQVHKEAGNVRPGMFDAWLGLFDMVLRQELPETKANAWSALAHRIGRTLRAGVVARTQGPGGVPMLRGGI